MSDQSVKVQLRKEARREELINAAFTLFMERGFAATRLEDVAVAAGVAKGTVVVYFPTKEALFRAVVHQSIDPLLAKTEELRDGPGSPRQRLAELVRFIAVSMRDPRIGGVPKLMVSEVGNFPDVASSFHNDVCQRSLQAEAEIIRQGIACGEFRQVDPVLAAHLIVDPIIMQAIWRHSLGRYECDQIDPDAYLETHLDTFLRGIAATPS